MELSWFLVLIKVEQLNHNSFSNTSVVKTNWKLYKCMTWRWADMKWNEMKKPGRVNARDIRQREAQVSTVWGWKEMRKRWYFNFLRKTEVERSEIQKSEIVEEVEWWGKVTPGLVFSSKVSCCHYNCRIQVSQIAFTTYGRPILE